MLISQLQKIANYSAPIRIFTFLGLLLIFWLPFVISFYFLLQKDPNLMNITTMGTLFIEFLTLTVLWGKLVYQKNNLFSEYGLIFSRQNGIKLINYLALGLGLTCGLFVLENTLGLINFQQPSLPLSRLILEGLLSGLGVALAEELVFRGWLLTELEKDYSLQTALISNSFIFALLHFLKPIDVVIASFPAFPGLILLAMNLILIKRNNQNKLGGCIGFHGGLVWGYYIFNVGNIVQYHDNISPWITGVDKNPIAGLIGLSILIFLLVINHKINQK